MSPFLLVFLQDLRCCTADRATLVRAPLHTRGSTHFRIHTTHQEVKSLTSCYSTGAFLGHKGVHITSSDQAPHMPQGCFLARSQRRVSICPGTSSRNATGMAHVDSWKHWDTLLLKFFLRVGGADFVLWS